MQLSTWKCFGPIVLSALSLFISFRVIQPIAHWIDPSFNLLASKDIGKIAFISMVIYQILLFISVQSSNFLDNFFTRNVSFLRTCTWLAPFFSVFALFTSIHTLLLIAGYQLGYVLYVPTWGHFTLSVIGKIAFGFIATFFLAWTEELIFRGTIYPYFLQYYRPMTSVLLTSTFFMLVHNLTNPLALVTTEWKLGLGLFLLGFFLNLLFLMTNKLYIGMGAHAGLVFVKVFLRKARFVIFAPEYAWAWWLHADLRQAHLIHILFVLSILLLLIKNKNKLFTFPCKITHP